MPFSSQIVNAPATPDAGERAVVATQTDTGRQHHGHQERGLALGQPAAMGRRRRRVPPTSSDELVGAVGIERSSPSPTAARSAPHTGATCPIAGEP
jgi:hypothetical protein